MIRINTRVLLSPTTGVQRYLREILLRMPADNVRTISPRYALSGFRGHLWEQTILPLQEGGKILWSPGNTGPLVVENQIVSILDMSVMEHPEWFSSNYSRWYQFLLPKLAKRVRKIFTLSEFSRERIIKNCRVDIAKVVVTPLGVSQKFRSRSLEEVTMMSKMLSLPATRYVLALGSLEPRKNLNVLLDAWGKALTGLPDDVWLVLSGAKGNPAVFREISFTNLPKRVYLTGYVPDEHLPALYSGADAFIYPSLYEGFGLPPLEAMSCGVPVIVSNTTSLPEVVGDAGIYVDPLDADDIANALRRIITDDDLRLSLQNSGLERVKSFSWNNTADITYQILMNEV